MPFTPIITLEKTAPNTFNVAPGAADGERVYGGQFLAQALRAALHTLEPDRHVHSLHAYFLRAGDVDQPIKYVVEQTRDGRSFNTRLVRATQAGRELFFMTASFQVPEPGLEFTNAAMPNVPSAESITTTFNDFSKREHNLARQRLGLPQEPDVWSGTTRPIDCLYVNPPSAPAGEPITESQRMWTRINGAMGDDPADHVAGLAYLSDHTLIDHVLLPHGHRYQDGEFQDASLDHAMWFHRPARADEWLLFDQTPEVTSGARGLASGRFYDRNGELVATCVQEGLIRKME